MVPMRDGKKGKHVSFLPPVELSKIQPPHTPPVTVHKPSQQPSDFFGFTRYRLHNKTEQTALNDKAKRAATAGYSHMTEDLRKQGASLLAFARQVGIAGNMAYAEFLVKENPQAIKLVDELTIGFYVGDHIKHFLYFCEKYKASFFAVIENARRNPYLRSTSPQLEVLKSRLKAAKEEEQDHLTKPRFDWSWRRKSDSVRSDSDASFTLSSDSFTLSP
jgi:hypothetical protein